MKRVISAIVATMVLLGTIPAFAAEPEYIGIMEDTGDYMYSQFEKNAVYGSEWYAVSLARSGMDIQKSAFIDYYENIATRVKEKKGILSERKYTEYAKTVLAAKALGRNPYDVGGHDLVSYLMDESKVNGQGINGTIWALIALDAAGYEGKENVSYMNAILKKELENGGWSMSATQTQIDVDITSMAITALSPYCDDDKVKAAIDRAMDAMMEKESAEGTYAETAGLSVNADTTAQVIIARSSMGLDCTKEIEGLLSFRKDRGFEHIKGLGVGAMTTEQAYLALAAYDRMMNGKSPLYDMSDCQSIILEKPSVTKVKLASYKEEKVKVSWDSVPMAKGYEISVEDGKSSEKLYTSSYLAKTLEKLVPGRTYSIKVRAYRMNNGSRLYGDWSDVSKISVKATIPGKAKLTSVKSDSKGKICVSWKKVSYAKSYQVSYKLKGKKAKVLSVKSCSKAITKLKSKKKYLIKVRAVRTAGGKSAYGNWSVEREVKVK